jgi:uncharacterized protein YjbJ (UPF0337 family)
MAARRENGVVMDNKDQVKGKVKQAVGDLTDNEDLKKERKDTADDLVDAVKDKVTKH